jgi:hypothetical protein
MLNYFSIYPDRVLFFKTRLPVWTLPLAPKQHEHIHNALKHMRLERNEAKKKTDRKNTHTLTGFLFQYSLGSFDTRPLLVRALTAKVPDARDANDRSDMASSSSEPLSAMRCAALVKAGPVRKRTKVGQTGEGEGWAIALKNGPCFKKAKGGKGDIEPIRVRERRVANKLSGESVSLKRHTGGVPIS